MYKNQYKFCRYLHNFPQYIGKNVLQNNLAKNLAQTKLPELFLNDSMILKINGKFWRSYKCFKREILHKPFSSALYLSSAWLQICYKKYSNTL